MSFALDPRLESLSHSISVIEDIDIRLANDCRFLWLYLVPQIPNIVEIEDMPAKTRERLMFLATDLSSALKSYANADKMNIAAIGNIVSQFHLHIVARHIGDAAWPDPIWGHGTMEPYDEAELGTKLVDLRHIVATIPHI